MVDKRTASNIEGMNPEKKPSYGAGFNEEFSNEPLTAAQRQHNKKKKKNQ